MGPLGALTTIERVATNAVMAGCGPDHMPIVVATLRALLRPEYDLSEAQSTTHSTSPLVVVSGPLADAVRHRRRVRRARARAIAPTRRSVAPCGCA